MKLQVGTCPRLLLANPVSDSVTRCLFRGSAMDTVKDLLEQNIIRLPSPPNVALRLMETIKQDQFSFAEVAEIIQYDPALTAKVLKVVNSAFYSFPERIGSIEQALKILGVHIVKNIVFFLQSR